MGDTRDRRAAELYRELAAAAALGGAARAGDHHAAIAVDESDVLITNTQFLENNCEDALNIIRSEFSMKNSKIWTSYWGSIKNS